MAQLIDIRKVTISQRALTALVHIADEAPLFTGDDPEGTELIAGLIPELANHACYGDGGSTFGEVMADTELAHLLEHVTVELLARTNRAGAVSAGQTSKISDIERLYEVRLACPDDVLVAGALSSASWIIDWAYNGGGTPEPDVDAIAQGLVALVESLGKKPEEAPAAEPEAIDPDATIVGAPIFDEPTPEAEAPVEEELDEPELEAEAVEEAPVESEEPAVEEAPAEEAEPEAAEEPEEEDPWAGEDIPAPRLIR